MTYEFNHRVLAIHTLRVNAKTLAAEAKVIRAETRRAGAQYRSALTEHRRGRLREEARYTYLAIAFLRGRSYKQAEGKTGKPVDARRLSEKLQRHGVAAPLEVKGWLVADAAPAARAG